MSHHNTSHPEEKLSKGELHLELMKGHYPPEEAEILLQFLQELEQVKKRKALGEWLKDHYHTVAPQDRPEVQELERMQKHLQELLDRAKKKGCSIELDLEGHFTLSSRQKEANKPKI